MVQVDSLLRSIHESYAEKGPLWRELVTAKLIELSIFIQRYSTSGSDAGRDTEEDIRKALSYVDRNVTGEIALSSVAEASVSYSK